MPYAQRLTGVYRLVNRADRVSYVGSSGNLLKRKAEHFRLLRLGQHPNHRLQEAFTASGEDAFDWVAEVMCADLDDARDLELLVLRGELHFEEAADYNIASDAFPMLGRKHSESTRKRISETKKKAARPLGDEATKTLQAAQRVRRFADPAHAEKVRFIVENDHLTYAERARAVGITTASAHKLFVRYAADYGKLVPQARRSYDRGISSKLEHIRANPDKTLAALAKDLGCSATSISALVRRYNLR